MSSLAASTARWRRTALIPCALIAMHTGILKKAVSDHPMYSAEAAVAIDVISVRHRAAINRRDRSDIKKSARARIRTRDFTATR